MDRLVGGVAGATQPLRSLKSELAVADAVLSREHEDTQRSDSELAERASRCARAWKVGKADAEQAIESLAVIRELAWRTLGMRHYRGQLVAGIALCGERFIEMATGEGKTLVSTIPGAVFGWRGKGCHILTVNDYLVTRDCTLNAPLFRALGLSCDTVTAVSDHAQRRDAYRCDITYLTAKEACADHLRDTLHDLGVRSFAGRLAMTLASGGRGPALHRGLEAAVLDEADSLLIDEATTPLLLSNARDTGRAIEAHEQACAIAARLVLNRDYTVRERYRDLVLTESGEHLIVASVTDRARSERPINASIEMVSNALRAHHFFERDRDYVIEDGRVVILDASTGRRMPDRTWRHGLHQAIEAKEHLDVSPSPQTVSSLSFQRFFRRYTHLCGMSGTLKEVATELRVVYDKPTRLVPTHRPDQRRQLPDRIYKRSDDRWLYVCERARALVADGRPVLIGTRSVHASEALSAMLQSRGTEHRVLNAIRHTEEAEIVAGAGRSGIVTIATSMAGRGTDIELCAKARDAGGLHVIIAEMNDAARVDRQLLGRAARQGDPGSGECLASLEDELFTRYGSATLLQAAQAGAGALVPGPISKAMLYAARRRASAQAAGQRLRMQEADERSDDALSFAPGVS